MASDGAHQILDALVAEDVRYFFNLPGNGLGPVLEALFDYPTLDYVMAVHEGPLVAMADGYARAAGRVGFANVYMVPGTANALSSIYTAHRDRSPLVITATQQSRRTLGRDAYASTHDLVGAMREFTKWSWEVARPDRLAEALHRAFKVAASPPPGPVFLSIPSDLITAEVQTPVNEPSRPSAVPVLGAPSGGAVTAIAQRLADAERLLIVCGQDVRLSRAVSSVMELAHCLGAPVVAEPWNGLVAVPKPHPLAFGEYNRDVLARFDPDVILSLGARMFVEALGVPEPAFSPKTQLIALGQSPEDLGRQFPAAVAAVCDMGDAVAAIEHACRGAIDPVRRERRLAEIARYRQETDAGRATIVCEQSDRRPMAISRLATELNRVIDEHTVVVEQATTSGGMLRTVLDQVNPYNWLSTGGSVQGWAMGAAVGAQLGRPEQPVLALVGDGGFAFGMQAVWTAAHYQIPVTWVVLDNRGYRSMRRNIETRTHEPTAAKPDFGFDFTLDIGQITRAMGGRSTRVADPGDVAEVVRTALADDDPHVIEVEISSKVEFVRAYGPPMAV